MLTARAAVGIVALPFVFPWRAMVVGVAEGLGFAEGDGGADGDGGAEGAAEPLGTCDVGCCASTKCPPLSLHADSASAATVAVTAKIRKARGVRVTAKVRWRTGSTLWLRSARREPCDPDWARTGRVLH